MKYFKWLLKDIFTEPVVWRVSKEIKVIAKSRTEAMNKAKSISATSPEWTWEAHRDAEDLF